MKNYRWGRIVGLLGASLALSFTFQNCTNDFIVAGDFGSVLGSLAEPGTAEMPAKLSCTVGTSGVAEKTMRRLTKTELVNSLTDLFGTSVMSNADVQSALQIIPEQTMPAGSFSNYDNSTPDVTGLLETSQKIVDTVFNNSSTVSTVLPGCANDASVCRTALVESFAYRAWRRPLSADEKSSILTLAQSMNGNDGLKYGIMRILLSPFFHQHVEIGEDAVTDSQRIKLTQFEIASRLSYRLTGHMPDATLLAEAAQGRLSSLPQIDVQARRLLQSTNARVFWRAFFDRWLDGQRILDPSQTVANEIGINATGLKAETREELLRFTDYIVFDKRGNFQDLFTDPTVFPYTDRLAKIFGTTRSDSGVQNTQGFAGVILRPGKLASGGNYTAPITRGVYIRKSILCSELPSPSPDIVASRSTEVEKYSHDQYSSRQITEAVTASTSCMGCHSLINPVGFALEGFGPLGRPRSAEKIYNMNGDTGTTHALNTYVENLGLSAVVTPASDATDLVSRISKSAVAKECFAQKLAESTRYRPLTAGDNCVVNDLRATAQAGSPIIDAIRASVVNESLMWKSLQGVQP